MADFDQYSTPVDASGDSKESHLDSKLEFSEDEKSLITRMYKLVGERWSLIAGRIPGRTAVEIEKYWTSTYSNNQLSAKFLRINFGSAIFSSLTFYK